MKNTVFYPALSAIISGIVLSIFGFYFFSSRPQDLSRNIQIQSYKFIVSQSILNSIAIKNTNNIDSNHDATTKTKELNNILGSIEKSLTQYKIINTGNYAVKNIEVNISKDAIAFYNDQNDKRIELSSGKANSISVMPKKEIDLIVLDNPYYISSSVNFLIDNKEVPVLNLDSGIDFFSTSIIYIYQYHTLAFILIIIISGISFLLIVSAIAMYIFVNDNPNKLSKLYDNAEIANRIALLNYIKEKEPERFGKIVKISEVVFSRWIEKKE